LEEKFKSEELLNIKFIFSENMEEIAITTYSSRKEELYVSRETVWYCSCNRLLGVTFANK